MKPYKAPLKEMITNRPESINFLAKESKATIQEAIKEFHGIRVLLTSLLVRLNENLTNIDCGV